MIARKLDLYCAAGVTTSIAVLDLNSVRTNAIVDNRVVVAIIGSGQAHNRAELKCSLLNLEKCKGSSLTRREPHN